MIGGVHETRAGSTYISVLRAAVSRSGALAMRLCRQRYRASVKLQFTPNRLGGRTKLRVKKLFLRKLTSATIRRDCIFLGLKWVSVPLTL